jgi:hypothetical protein
MVRDASLRDAPHHEDLILRSEPSSARVSKDGSKLRPSRLGDFVAEHLRVTLGIVDLKS